MSFTATSALGYHQMYDINDIDPIQLIVDDRYQNLSIIVETWNVASPPPNIQDIPLTEANFVDSGATGTVTLGLSPRFSHRFYPAVNNEGVIDLADVHFLNVGVNIRAIKPTFAAITGCTHISVAIVSAPL